jgi:hypothetical protein
MLEEVAGGDHPLELGLVHEVVVLRVALARPRWARGIGDRQRDARRVRQHGIDDARLACADGARR